MTYFTVNSSVFPIEALLMPYVIIQILFIMFIELKIIENLLKFFFDFDLWLLED